MSEGDELAAGGRRYRVRGVQSLGRTTSSVSGVEPEVTRLGSGEWTQTKARVRRAVREMAFELIQLYATRQAGAGFQFPPDSKWDHELAESFPFTETRDRARWRG